MAGHRKYTGRPKQADARRTRMHRRTVGAATAEEQLAAAFDWFRMAVRRRSPGERTTEIHAVVTFLADWADAMDRRSAAERTTPRGR